MSNVEGFDFCNFNKLLKNDNMILKPIFRSKKYTLLILNLFISIISMGQQNKTEENLSWKEKFFWGGNLGLQFGTYTYVEAAPLAGFHLKPNLDWAAGFTYIYSKNSITNYSNQLYGANTYLQFTLIQPVVIHAQAEIINSDYFDLNGNAYRDWFEAFLIGGGIKQQIGTNSYSFLLVLWNMNNSYYSPYQNPVIKVGLIF